MRTQILGLMLGVMGFAVQAQENKIEISFAYEKGVPFYKNDEAQPKSGTYFSLRASGDTLSLKRVHAHKKPTVVKGYDHDGPGVLFQCDAKNSVFLVRGLSKMKEGRVKTWYWNGFSSSTENPRMPRLFRKEIQCGDESVLFTGAWKSPERNSGDGEELRWRVQTSRGAWDLDLISTWLLGPDEAYSVDEYLVWVGDLDGDGEPDFLVRPQSRHDSPNAYLELSLYLSSQKKTKESWHPVARFSFWDPAIAGC